jgi:hypothetical protein
LISSFLNKKGLFALSFLATPQNKTKALGNVCRALHGEEQENFVVSRSALL